MDSGIKNNPIIVTSDGYVLDGHHRWAAALALGRNWDAYVVDLPIRKAFEVAGDFNDRHNIEGKAFDTPTAQVFTTP
jgi:ParB-like nuclease domain